jgi:plasmid stabilization system protein ParE
MSHEIIVTESAARELDEAYDWLVARTTVHAPTWYNGLLEAILSLQQMPGRCPLCSHRENSDQQTRQLVYGDKKDAYLIIFEIRGEKVFVWHIRHAARQGSED